MVVQAPDAVETPRIETPETYITFEEFLTLDIEGRAEWVDGKVEKHMSVSLRHDQIFMFLAELLRIFLRRRKLGSLHGSSYPMKIPNLARGREPDLMIVLKEHQDRRTPTFLDGVADICIEIVSPESVERDYVTKFEEYEKGGVAEYWLFDANRRTAVFHVLDASGIYQEYPRDPKGRLISSLLPGFALDPAFLWSDDLLDDDAVATAIEAILAN